MLTVMLLLLFNRRAAGSDAATSVELDPSAEVEVRGTMAAAGQRCVGWYHSHPVFEARPSLKDMENQRNYQALTRDKSEQVQCSRPRFLMFHALRLHSVYVRSF